MPPRVLLTGAPRSGKSTLALAVVDALRERGVRIAGMSSPEIREGGRTGFKLVDLASGTERVMASVRIRSPHAVGKYGVDVAAIDEIAARFVRSIEDADLLVIDEIGRMEQFSGGFREAVEAAFRSEKPLLAVVHRALVKRYEGRGEVLQASIPRFDALKRLLLERFGTLARGGVGPWR